MTIHSCELRARWTRLARGAALSLLVLVAGTPVLANTPSPASHLQPTELVLLGNPSVRREPASRHEPATLDRLEGAELADDAPTPSRKRDGVQVMAVQFASAMWRNGLRPDDIIVGVEGRAVRSPDDLERALAGVAWPFELDVIRGDLSIRIIVP
jgi:hypothetical protein